MRGMLFLLAFVTLPAVAQSEGPCNAPRGEALDYMLGDWFGVQYVYQQGDTTMVATTELSVREILDGCAHEELMDVHRSTGEHVFNAIALRSYDVSEQRWRFTEVDDRGRHFTLEGREEQGQWYFYADRERDGRAYILRLSYPQAGPDSFKQIFERSFDAGTTWERWTHIDFVRDKPNLR